MRFTALDGLRGCCALMVVLFHFNYLSHVYHLPFLRNSYLFVDFFFVLSGFVISSAYGERLGRGVSARQFIVRRIGRVWPLHVAVLLALIANEALKLALNHWIPTEKPPFTGDTSIPAIVTNLLLIHSLGVHDRLTWNHPSWSISVEFAMYLVFACVVIVCPKRRAVVFAVLAAFGAGVLAKYSPEFMNATYDYGIFRCLYGFSLGSLTWLAYRRFQTLALPRVAEYGVLAAAIAFVYFCGYGTVSLFAPLVFMLVVYVFAYERGLASAWLNARAMQALGLWSYSIYMVHTLVLTVMEQALKLAAKFGKFPLSMDYVTDQFGDSVKLYVFASPWVMDGLMLLYIGMVLAVAACSYRWIEMPCRNWFNRFAREAA